MSRKSITDGGGGFPVPKMNLRYRRAKGVKDFDSSNPKLPPGSGQGGSGGGKGPGIGALIGGAAAVGGLSQLLQDSAPPSGGGPMPEASPSPMPSEAEVEAALAADPDVQAAIAAEVEAARTAYEASLLKAKQAGLAVPPGAAASSGGYRPGAAVSGAIRRFRKAQQGQPVEGAAIPGEAELPSFDPLAPDPMDERVNQRLRMREGMRPEGAPAPFKHDPYEKGVNSRMNQRRELRGQDPAPFKHDPYEKGVNSRMNQRRRYRKVQ